MALVITIIIILILAGISISMLSGDNSIINKAGEAKNLTEEKDISEKVQIAYLRAMSKAKGGEATRALLETELNEVFGDNNYQLSPDLKKVTINDKEYDEDGNVTKGGSGLTLQADGTFKDSKGNEWVWIEVPNDGTGPLYPANATDTQIEEALRDYCSDVIDEGYNYKTSTNGHVDTWYSGCGLEENEYNTTKSKMLNSIKDNGGFYIGKYETGIDDSNIAENATETVGLRIASGNTTQIAVVEQNKEPYIYVTCSQAENLAKGFATDGKTASLLFGIQWDLVLKYIKVKENLSDIGILITDSGEWGNYKDKTYNITDTKPWHSVDYGANWTKGAYNKTLDYKDISLTTGAHADFFKQNISDFAGSVWEWTLEKSYDSSEPCTCRGGGYFNNSFDCPVSIRDKRSYRLFELHGRFQSGTLLIKKGN